MLHIAYTCPCINIVILQPVFISEKICSSNTVCFLPYRSELHSRKSFSFNAKVYLKEIASNITIIVISLIGV